MLITQSSLREFLYKTNKRDVFHKTSFHQIKIHLDYIRRDLLKTDSRVLILHLQTKSREYFDLLSFRQ